MVLGDFSDLARRTASDKIFDDKAFNIAKSPKYDGYQRGLVWMIYNFDDKKLVKQLKMRIFHTKNLQNNYANQY